MENLPLSRSASDLVPATTALFADVAFNEGLLRRISDLLGTRDPELAEAREEVTFEFALSLIGAFTRDNQSPRAYQVLRLLDPVVAEMVLELVREVDFVTGALMPEQRMRAVVLTAAGLMSVVGLHDEAIEIVCDLLVEANYDLDYAHALFVAKRKKRGLSDDLSGQFCPVPFERFDVWPEGDVSLCCGNFLRRRTGNIHTDETDTLWNGQIAQEIRETIHDGTYRYCDKVRCRKFEIGLVDLAKSDEQILEEARPYEAAANEGSSMDQEMLDFARSEVTIVPTGPRMVNLAFDRTCNLTCPSCRNEMISAKPDERDRLIRLADEKIMPLLKDTRLLVVTGSGDPFASKTFRHIMHNLDPYQQPELELKIMTNAVLFTPAEWEKIAHLHGRIRSVTVSIDAARPDTYAVVRRGGNWEKLQANLHFLGGLRSEGAFHEFRLAFCVQDNNWREIPEFIDMGRAVGASVVHFAPIENWGTFSHEGYAQKAMQYPSHPDHEAFKALLESMDLTDPYAEFGVLEEYMKKSPIGMDWMD